MGSFRVLFMKHGPVPENIWVRRKEDTGRHVGSLRYFQGQYLVFYWGLNKWPHISGSEHPLLGDGFRGTEAGHSMAQLSVCLELHKAKIKASAGLCSFQRLWGKNLLPNSFKLSKSSYLQMQGWGPCCSAVCQPGALLSSSKLPTVCHLAASVTSQQQHRCLWFVHLLSLWPQPEKVLHL